MVSNLLQLQETPRFSVFAAQETCAGGRTIKCPAALPKKAVQTTTGMSTTADGLSANRNPTMNTDGSAVTVSVGARRVLLEDVLLVAVHGARIDLHQASLDKACTSAQGYKAGSGPDESFDVRYDS